MTVRVSWDGEHWHDVPCVSARIRRRRRINFAWFRSLIGRHKP